MPTRIENILLRARDTLADPNKERYTDSRLLRLLSDGLQDINSKAKLLRSRTNLIPLDGVAEYALPSDVWVITRTSVKGRKLPLHTYDDLDDNDLINSNWQTRKSASVEAVIYDRVNQGIVRLYPIPSATDAELIFSFNSDFGVITNASPYLDEPPFGISFISTEEGYVAEYSQLDGEITSLEEQLPTIVVHYYALAPELTSVQDNIPISYLFDRALKHYVTGYAALDDLDTRSASLAQTEINLYTAELSLAQKASLINNTKSDREITYTGPFSHVDNH